MLSRVQTLYLGWPGSPRAERSTRNAALSVLTEARASPAPMMSSYPSKMVTVPSAYPLPSRVKLLPRIPSPGSTVVVLLMTAMISSTSSS